MKTSIPLLLIALLVALPLGAGLNDGYVGCSTDDSAAGFDLTTFATGTPFSVLPEANYPYDATLRPDGSEVWMPGASGDGIVVIDRASDSITQRISVCEYAISVAFSLDASFAIVTCRDTMDAWIVDTATYTVTGTLPFPADPGNAALDPVTGRFYVVEWFGDLLFEVSADASAIERSQSIGDSLWQLVVAPDGSAVYVTDRGTDQVRVVDPVSLTETRAYAVGDDPWGIDITSDGAKLVVACEDDAAAPTSQVDIIDIATGNQTAVALPADADARDVDILDQDQRAFVVGGSTAASGAGDPVYVIDLVTDSLEAEIDIPCSNTNVLAVQAGFVAPVCDDQDGDGYGDPGSPDCPAGSARDCDDSNRDVNPAATEQCANTIDDDCDSLADCDDIDDCVVDSDADTVPDAPCGNDCDDDDPDNFPGNPEVCDDASDNDCDSLADCDDIDDCVVDSDADTVPDAPCGNDCDDDDPDNFPGNPEVCDDASDNDCDSLADCDDIDDCVVDSDADTVPDAPCGNDCDDDDPDNFPGNPEVCDDASDNDCDSLADCDDIDDCVVDSDADTVPDAPCGNDCDDDDPDNFPGNPEACDDASDNDCDTAVDCDDSDCLEDIDGDTFIEGPCGEDCDDGNGSVWRSPPEIPTLVWQDKKLLVWDDLSSVCGPGTDYQILQGELGDWPVGAGPGEICIGPEPNPQLSDPTPDAAASFFFLVRGRNECSPSFGPWGYDSQSAERTSPACP